VSHRVDASRRPSGEIAWSTITGSNGGVGPPVRSRARRSRLPRRLKKWMSRRPLTAVITPLSEYEGDRYGLPGVPFFVIARWRLPFPSASQTSPRLM
jgi:hypothetical protein